MSRLDYVGVSLTPDARDALQLAQLRLSAEVGMRLTLSQTVMLLTDKIKTVQEVFTELTKGYPVDSWDAVIDESSETIYPKVLGEDTDD